MRCLCVVRLFGCRGLLSRFLRICLLGSRRLYAFCFCDCSPALRALCFLLRPVVDRTLDHEIVHFKRSQPEAAHTVRQGGRGLDNAVQNGCAVNGRRGLGRHLLAFGKAQQMT